MADLAIVLNAGRWQGATDCAKVNSPTGAKAKAMATKFLSAAADLKKTAAEQAQAKAANAIAGMLAAAKDAAALNESLRYAAEVLDTLRQTGDGKGKRFACKGVSVEQPDMEVVTLSNAFVTIVKGKRIPSRA